MRLAVLVLVALSGCAAVIDHHKQWWDESHAPERRAAAAAKEKAEQEEMERRHFAEQEAKERAERLKVDAEKARADREARAAFVASLPCRQRCVAEYDDCEQSASMFALISSERGRRARFHSDAILCANRGQLCQGACPAKE